MAPTVPAHQDGTQRPPTPLPTTRLVRMQRERSGWGLGVVLTIIANLGIVLLLAGVSHLAEAGQELPPKTMQLRSITPADAAPPPPAPAQAEPEPLDEVAEELITELAAPTVALPPVELGSHGDSSLQLPAITADVALTDMAMAVPAFAAPAAITTAGDPTAAVAVAPMADFGYDEAPRLLRAIDLSRYYPRRARARGLTGRSIITLTIDATGKVIDARLVSSEPPGVFDRAAVRCGKAQSFMAAKRNGQSVASRFTLTLEWSIK